MKWCVYYIENVLQRHGKEGSSLSLNSVKNNLQNFENNEKNTSNYFHYIHPSLYLIHHLVICHECRGQVTGVC